MAMCCYAECSHSECQGTNENKAEKGFDGLCCYAECHHSECQHTNENKAEKGFDSNVLLC